MPAQPVRRFARFDPSARGGHYDAAVAMRFAHR
jgi:hypothetical protein